jgi:hypothetical protein
MDQLTGPVAGQVLVPLALTTASNWTRRVGKNASECSVDTFGWLGDYARG